MKASAMIFAVSMLALAADPGGLRPRPNPSEYPAHETGSDVAIGAAVLTPAQVKSTFATDLREYLVIEVALYPAPGQTLDVNTGDFALKIGTQGETVRAANPRAMAASNQRKNSPRPSRASDVTLYPSATIGYETNRGYDPVTGRQRGGGVYTDTGVGVGIGGQGAPPRPGSTDRDRDVMNQELTDKTLPEGKTNAPAAGYLYFRLPAKARTSALDLQYFAPGGKVQVPLPPVRK